MLSSQVVLQSFLQNRLLALAPPPKCADHKLRVYHLEHTRSHKHDVLSIYFDSLSLTMNHRVHRTPSISSTNRTKPKQRATITIARLRSDTG